MCHVLEGTNSLHSVRKHELGLAAHEVSSSSVDVPLIGLEFAGQYSNVIVDLAVAGNLPGQPSVISLSHHRL